MKNLLLLLLLFGCSTEGTKYSLDTDPSASRGGVGREADAMPIDTFVKTDTQVVQPDAQIVQPDTQVAVQAKPDTSPPNEDTGPKPDGIVVVKPDTQIVQPDTQPKDVQGNVITITPGVGDEKTYCMNPAGVTAMSSPPTDLSKGKCVEIAPVFYLNGQWTQYTCEEILKGTPCNTVLINECGYCKVSCSRCR